MKASCTLFGAILVLLCAWIPMVLAGDAVHSETGSGNIFARVSVENRDEAVELHWDFVNGALESGIFAGVRVYRMLDGDEIRHGVKPLQLVEDVGRQSTLKVSGLKNGSRVIFTAQAYDKDGKDVEGVIIHGLPGSKAKSVPPTVKNIYTASGPWAVSVFWDPLEQVNITEYEVLRRPEHETEFRLLGRMKKVVGIDGKQTGAVMANVLPEIQPTMFRDKTVLPGLSYVYQVRAVDADGKVGEGVESEPASLQPDRSPLPEEVLLLTSWTKSDSKQVARYYARKRGVPEENILEVTFYRDHKFRNRQVLAEVREHLLNKGLAGKIRVIVPCFGMPLGDGQRALDSMLMDPFDRYAWGRVMGTSNPMFGRDMNHDPSYGIYLVSRLDGPTPEIAMGLVDKALEAEKIVSPGSGSAFFTTTAFGQEGMAVAKRHGVQARSEDRSYTLSGMVPEQTMWLFADGHDYKAIRKSPWPVGSVAGYLKSNTLASIRDKETRYWVQGMLEEGVTATYGAAIEPYLQGYTRGDILLDRFWGGRYTFAEAFAMATPTVRWAMCAVGDPLYKLKAQ